MCCTRKGELVPFHRVFSSGDSFADRLLHDQIAPMAVLAINDDFEGVVCTQFAAGTQPAGRRRWLLLYRTVERPGRHGARAQEICGACGHDKELHTAPHYDWQLTQSKVEEMWAAVDTRKPLGTGTTSTVWQAECWGGVWAVKELKTGSLAQRKEMQKELRMMVQLRHPNLLRECNVTLALLMCSCLDRYDAPDTATTTRVQGSTLLASMSACCVRRDHLQFRDRGATCSGWKNRHVDRYLRRSHLAVSDRSNADTSACAHAVHDETVH
eukprot:COSAG01_NODE_8781_length_2661_cov_2.509758_2_plen_269_part_00